MLQRKKQFQFFELIQDFKDILRIPNKNLLALIAFVESI